MSRGKDNAVRRFRNQWGQLVIAEGTDNGRVVLTFRPLGPDKGTLIVSEAEAEAMVERGELVSERIALDTPEC